MRVRSHFASELGRAHRAGNLCPSFVHNLPVRCSSRLVLRNLVLRAGLPTNADLLSKPPVPFPLSSSGYTTRTTCFGKELHRSSPHATHATQHHTSGECTPVSRLRAPSEYDESLTHLPIVLRISDRVKQRSTSDETDRKQSKRDQSLFISMSSLFILSTIDAPPKEQA